MTTVARKAAEGGAGADVEDATTDGEGATARPGAAP